MDDREREGVEVPGGLLEVVGAGGHWPWGRRGRQSGRGGGVGAGAGAGGAGGGGGGGGGGNGDWGSISGMGQSSTLTTIGMDTNATLAYGPGMEHHHPIMSTLGGWGDPL